jgi:hypothetical protein
MLAKRLQVANVLAVIETGKYREVIAYSVQETHRRRHRVIAARCFGEPVRRDVRAPKQIAQRPHRGIREQGVVIVLRSETTDVKTVSD